MPPICPNATWIPTPVKNPTSTVLDRKSARNPRPMIRARIRKTATRMASTAARATYSSDPTAARPMRPAARMAAVAESAPTTRCREAPKIAYRAIGMRMV